MFEIVTFNKLFVLVLLLELLLLVPLKAEEEGTLEEEGAALADEEVDDAETGTTDVIAVEDVDCCWTFCCDTEIKNELIKAGIGILKKQIPS